MNVRKAIYQKILSSLPPNSTDAAALSMQYSQFKKRREKLADVHGFQEPEESPHGVIRVDLFSKTVARPRKDGGVGEKRKSEDFGNVEKKIKSC